LFALDNAAVGYDPANPVLRGLNQRLDQDDRIALLGGNGNGKTTFVRLLSGRLQPLQGKLTTPPKLRVGYFSQDQADELDLAATPVDHMARALPEAGKTKIRSHLGRFGFTQDKADVEVGKLSGGEKARLLFALMTRDAPHVLMLDEPTNHLDIEARQALIEALNAYQGAVVLVTHDPHLIELVADRLWVVADGGVRAFDGDLEDYRRALLAQRRAERQAARKQADAAGDQTRSAAREPGVSKKEKRKQAADQRAQQQHLRKKAQEAERTLEKLNAKKAQLEATLADPQVYQGPTAKLQELQVAHGEVKDAIARAEEAWLELQEKLEDAG
jgi:ATP-binding cassette subfamily F protein 3